MRRRPSLDPLHSIIPWLTALFLCLVSASVHSQGVVLHLKSGDRISGMVVSESTNQVTISNVWANTISVPISEIARREKAVATPEAAAANTVVSPIPPPVAPTPAKTEPAKTKSKSWKGEVQFGLDVLLGKVDHQIYSGRLTLNYQHPYKSDPKEFFKNTFDFRAEYGRTDGTISSDRLNASDKTDFDFTRKWYLYNLVGGGYDHVQRIDLQYEAGPGAGYHLFTETNFLMNLEAGINYQAKYRQEESDVKNFYYRLAEDFSWKLNKQTSLIEKYEFFPQVDLREYRFRFESTLSHELWKNLALNLTVLDLYDTQPAAKVDHNELQVRSSLGLKF